MKIHDTVTVYPHAYTDGTTRLLLSDISDCYRDAVCLGPVEIQVSVTIPGDLHGLVMDCLDDRECKVRADMEERLARLRDTRQRFLALPCDE